jgi:hypothetical protein
MKNKGQFPAKLKECILMCGAPLELISDGAKEENSYEVKDICRDFMIRRHWNSEPHNQQQNPAERVIGDVQRAVNVNMDRSGSPAPTWLLCTLHTVDVLCVTSQPSLGGLTPYQKLFSFVPDVSAYLAHHWWQPVRYSDNVTSLDQSKERAGRFVGVADNVGDDLTYWILDEETHQCVARSIVTNRKDALHPNLRLEMPNVSATDEGELFVYTKDGLEEHFSLTELS